MSTPQGDRLYVNLGASAARRRLKGRGLGVRKVESAGKNRAAIVHTATGPNLRKLEALFSDALDTETADAELVEEPDFFQEPEDVPTGRYRHYKGQEYVVLGVARHSETEEELVVYRQDYGDRSLWVRPKSMFLERVEVEGQVVPRFEFVGPD